MTGKMLSNGTDMWGKATHAYHQQDVKGSKSMSDFSVSLCRTSTESFIYMKNPYRTFGDLLELSEITHCVVFQLKFFSL